MSTSTITTPSSRVESVNPATEAVIASFEQFTPAQVEQALVDADAAFHQWRPESFAERSRAMRGAAELLRSRKERYAGLITAEMGKPITQAEAEVEKCAWVCDYFAEHAERFLARQPVQTNARVSYVAFEPLGVVLAVMPWNFPFWQVFRFAAPTLMAGNTAVLKHASNVPQCALAIEEVFRDAGFPRGALRTVLVPGGAVEAIIDDPRVRAVTLTGSNTTGEKVAAAAGRAIKKTVLELGGSDPFVVLDDADLAAAAATAVRSRFQNGGQSCIAAKRFIVVASVAEEFERRFVEGIRKLKVGDPTDRSVDVGPLARADLRDTVDRQVRESAAQGARVVLGGAPRPGRGYFYQPTLLVDVVDSSAAWREELFGPVAVLVRAQDRDAAIALRAHGRDVTTEAYPYDAGMTEIQSATIQDVYRNASDERLAELEWPRTGERLHRESFERYSRIGGPVVVHTNTEQMVAVAITSPLTIIASDAYWQDGAGHPRTTGTFAKVLSRYVREAHSLSLMDAIRKMTLMPAQRLEARVPAMRQKGRLQVGADADITIFDTSNVLDRSTYREPSLSPVGIQQVIVNGVSVVANGRAVEGVAPGKAVRAPR